MSSVPDRERSEQVQRGKPSPDRSRIEVGPRFTTPLWLIVIGPVILIFGSLLIGPWAFCALVAVILTINVMKRSPGPTRRSERARLLADCDAQHAAWKQGHDRVAFFGRFPPPGNWKLGYLDGQRAEDAPAAKPVFEPWWRATA